MAITPSALSYTLTETVPVGYSPLWAAPGTDNGTTNGSTVVGNVTQVGQIALNGGDSAINYDFSVYNISAGQ
jgi:hypothetical protein